MTMLALAVKAGLLMTVALYIQGSLAQCTDGDVRLVDGPASNEGVVEVCINSNWGVVCAADSWGRTDAAVICRQLGYPSYALVDAYYDEQQEYFNRLNNVYSLDCDPEHDTSLIDCGSRSRSQNVLCHQRIAYLVCRDDKRVLNVNAQLITTAGARYVHIVSITWVQNASAAEPTSFEVKCQNDFNTITVIVNNKTNSTEQIGLLPSSCYSCCVSGVYRDVYVSQERCKQIVTPDPEANTSIISASCLMVDNTLDTRLSTTEFDHETSEPDFVSTTIQMSSDSSVQASSSTSVVGGALGFIIVLLLVLLIISLVVLVCVLRPSERLKNSALYGRLARLDTTRSTTVPAYNNPNYISQTPTCRTQPQAVTSRPANQTTAQSEGGATVPNYSSIGPDYESIESRRQVQMEGGSNRVNMRERYEVHAETDGQNGVQGSMDYEVPVPSASQSEDYSHLQH